MNNNKLDLEQNITLLPNYKKLQFSLHKIQLSTPTASQTSISKHLIVLISPLYILINNKMPLNPSNQKQ